MEERTEKILSLKELQIERQQDLILESLRNLNQELLQRNWIQDLQKSQIVTERILELELEIEAIKIRTAGVKRLEKMCREE